MKRKLSQYAGALSAAEIAEGMNAAAANAGRLYVDAEILLNAGRFPTATALAILAIEEAGKTAILRQMAVATTREEVADAWKAYRSHTKKNVSWPLASLVAGGARRLEEFSSLFADASEHPHLAEQVKQIALYTDCLGRRHWSKPSEVVDEKLARAFVDAARPLIPRRLFSTREIELWQEYLGPVWRAGLPAMTTGLRRWFSAMKEEGLDSAGDELSVARFLAARGRNTRKP